ncbi:TrbG/VirB9 family P-type conjugative transfer protein [Sphingomonas sp. DT-204]|uniref:TrbG/VirB9 family P-type conjugative transfer protein n=1 Tax=Sphingomonas sp. DT-204 TaxID=3396166 RepID=UPI003F1DA80E
MKHVVAFLLWIGLLSIWATAALAGPQGGARTRTIDFRPGQMVPVEAAIDRKVAIELSPEERVQNVAVGDSSAWQTSVHRDGNRVFVKAVRSGPPTNMTIITNFRTYSFQLSAVPKPTRATSRTIRFRYPPPPKPPSTAGANAMRGLYTLSGARELRPSAISDDGSKTYIEWPADASLPATFVIDDHGREALANGYMRGGLYVIDSVSQRVIFRVDRRKALADRLPEEGR